MAISIQKTVPFFCLFFACFIMYCASSSTEDQSEDYLNQGDSTGFLQKTVPTSGEPSPIDTIKKLPVWPLKYKPQKGKALPFDEAPKDPSFTAFRAQLYQAVLDKNDDFLISVIHDDIKFSFGAENGKADFLKVWNLNANAEKSELWPELEAILQLGGGFMEFSKKGFYAPYIFVLRDIEDPYTQAVIIGEKVRLRAQPSSQGKIIGSLNWDVVTLISEEELAEETINNETHAWQRVETAIGESGYVYGKFIRSPIDFRAGFSPYDGQWKMDLFIAGD